jgi:two-component sensor histidine kinase/CheY-like chemotaxis protein
MSTKPRETILVIEDEQAIRESITGYLEDLDYPILAAENGRKGIDLIKTRHPDLVLTDLRMPEVSGIEVLSYVKQNFPDMPVIIVSGANVFHDVVEALRLGAWNYLIKPIMDLSVLSHAVQTALEQARLIRENLEYREHLEQLVEERTEKLRETNEQLNHINKRLRQLSDSEIRLSACTQIWQYAHQLLEEFSMLMDAHGGSIYLLEEDLLKRVHAIDTGHAPEFLSLSLSEKSVFGKVMKSGKPLLIHDIREETDIDSSRWKEYSGFSLISFPIFNEKGNILGIISLHNRNKDYFTDQDLDIGNILISFTCEALHAVQITESLQKSLSEKVILLKEIHHRVKNNFQLILSLISLQQSVPAAVDDSRALRDLEGRVQSMALVHEELYQKENLSSIDVKMILNDLFMYLHNKFRDAQPPVKIQIESDNSTMVLDLAVPFALLNYEILANAYEHAFSVDSKEGLIRITFQTVRQEEKNLFQLCIEDNGIGLPDKYESLKQSGLGFRLIDVLTYQLQGKLSVQSEPEQGTSFRVVFPQ